MPVGLQLQALYHSKGSVEQMQYTEKKLEEIVNAGLANRGDYEDWCNGIDFLQAFRDGCIKKGDPVLMFFIDDDGQV